MTIHIPANAGPFYPCYSRNDNATRNQRAFAPSRKMRRFFSLENSCRSYRLAEYKMYRHVRFAMRFLQWYMDADLKHAIYRFPLSFLLIKNSGF